MVYITKLLVFDISTLNRKLNSFQHLFESQIKQSCVEIKIKTIDVNYRMQVIQSKLQDEDQTAKMLDHDPKQRQTSLHPTQTLKKSETSALNLKISSANLQSTCTNWRNFPGLGFRENFGPAFGKSSAATSRLESRMKC